MNLRIDNFTRSCQNVNKEESEPPRAKARGFSRIFEAKPRTESLILPFILRLKSRAFWYWGKKVLRGGIFLFALVMFLFLPPKVFAQVVINEFSSGTTSDWVEFYNKGTEAVSLTDYRIRDSGGSNEKDLSGDLFAGDVLKVTFSNYLNNGGDIVKLLKVSGQTEELLEEIPYGSEGGICAPGENGSVGRFPDGNLPYIRFTASSPGSSNNLSQEEPCPTPTPTPTLTPPPPTPEPTLTPTSTEAPATATPVPTNTPAPSTYENIFISEFMAWPESGNEWVEIFNNNDSEVNLFGWYIDDKASGGQPPISISEIIVAKSYKQFYLKDRYLNDDGDDVRLLDGSQTEKDKKSFSSSTKGKSWSKDSSGDWCQADPTPNSANSDCPDSTSTLTLSPTPTLNLTPTPTPKTTPPLSATVSGEVMGEETASGDDQFKLAGAAKGLSDNSQDEVKEIKKLYQPPEKKRSLLFSLIAIGGGLALIFFSVFSYLKSKQ